VTGSTVAASLPIDSQESAVSAGSGNTLNGVSQAGGMAASQTGFPRQCQPRRDLNFRIFCLEAASSLLRLGEASSGSKFGLSRASSPSHWFPPVHFCVTVAHSPPSPVRALGQKLCRGLSQSSRVQLQVLCEQDSRGVLVHLLYPLSFWRPTGLWFSTLSSASGSVSATCTSRRGRQLNPLCPYRAYPQHGSLRGRLAFGGFHCTARAGLLCDSLRVFSYQDKRSSDLGSKRGIIFFGDYINSLNILVNNALGNGITAQQGGVSRKINKRFKTEGSGHSGEEISPTRAKTNSP